MLAHQPPPQSLHSEQDANLKSGNPSNSPPRSLQTVENLLSRPRVATSVAVALVFLALWRGLLPGAKWPVPLGRRRQYHQPGTYLLAGARTHLVRMGRNANLLPVSAHGVLGRARRVGRCHAGLSLSDHPVPRRLRVPSVLDRVPAANSRALLAAALFAVHPVYVESLAWITEQKNTLSGMFYLGSILVYLHFDDDRRRSQYALALGLFLLSLFSKTTAVTLPVALLVILWWKRGARSWRRDLAPLVPWFTLSLVFGIFTAWYEKIYVGAAGKIFELTWLQKCLLASRAVWFYLSKLFWPANLTFIYPRWEVNPADAWQYVYPAGLLALFVVAWRLRRRWRAPLAALLYFVGTLFPLLGFFSTYIFTYTYACDHFQYLPSLGIVVLVSAGATIALSRLPAAGQRIGQGACLLLLSALAWLTWQQSQMYCDIITLYQTTIDRNPSCWMAHTNLGTILTDTGRPQEAIEYYQEGLRLNPDSALTHYDLGRALAQRRSAKRSDRTLPTSTATQSRLCRGPQQPGQCPGQVRLAAGSHRTLPAGAGAGACQRRGALQSRQCSVRCRPA